MGTAPCAEVRTDGFANIITGLGTAQRDKRLASEIQAPAILARIELDDLYAGDGLARRICDLPANEQTRKWIGISADDDVGKDTLQRLQTLAAQDAVTEAMIWARLYGGSVILLGIDDGLDPAKPLTDTAAIKSFTWLNVLNRYEVEITQRYLDPFAPQYGKPELYKVMPSIAGPGSMMTDRIVHESRVIRFDGVRTPRYRLEQNAGWCDSIFVALLNTIRDVWSGFDGTAHLLTDFSQAIYKVKGLASQVGSNQEATILKRLQILDMVRSLMRAVVIDADGEDFTRSTTPLTGLPEVLDRLEQLLSAVTEIPVTLLFGRSPAGLNATGESDVRLFYDAVQSKQENQLRPKLERLLTLLFRAKDGPTGGVEPEEWSFKFNPLWQLTDAERADLHSKQSAADQIYISNGVLHPEEVRESRFGGDEYSVETQLDPSLSATDEIQSATPDPNTDSNASDMMGSTTIPAREPSPSE